MNKSDKKRNIILYLLLSLLFSLSLSCSLSQKKMRQVKKDLLSFTRSTYIYILKMLYNHYSYDLVHREKENEYKKRLYIYIYSEEV